MSTIAVAGPAVNCFSRGRSPERSRRAALGYSASLSPTIVIAGEPCPFGLRYAPLEISSRHSQDKKDIYNIEKMPNNIEVLKRYLKSNSVIPEGHLDEDIRNQNNDALFYIIYAIRQFPYNLKLIDKIKLLAKKRGLETNDIRRNYENQLFEFHALYILIERMNYNFIDFEVASNKSYARINTNCDILVEKDHRQYYIDAKQSSTQLMSQFPNLKYNDVIDINNLLFPEVLEKYIKRLVRDAEQKGCDFLVLHIPKWGLPDLKLDYLTNFLKNISKEIENKNGKWAWPMKNTHIKKLIFPKSLEYFEIDIC